ncbi:MAG: hypothetical protein LQ338_006904 [Usnochroma carphineum]|nr:MAG: hypothetical protein LQ338_006904 [Usnochroma carphineum]
MGDIATRTRRYLRAVKRYEKRAMAQQERVRISDDKRSQGLPDSAPLVSPESPERRRRIIAGRAGLLLAEVPVVALWLEEPVRHLERLPSISIPHHAGGLWEWCLGKPHGWWIRLKQQSQTTIGSWQGKLIPLFVSGYFTWRAAEAKTLYVMIFYAMVLCNLSSVHDWIQWAWERFME